MSTRNLRPRELTVLRLIDAGMTNPQIAESLGLAQQTVKNYTHILTAKLGCKPREYCKRESAPPQEVRDFRVAV